MKASKSPNSTNKNGRTKKSDSPNRHRTRNPLAPEVEQWMAAEGCHFPTEQSSMIPLLQSAQGALGYLPSDAMTAIARHLVLPPAQVEGVASFYSQFRFNKPGRNRVTVCTGTACYVRGSGKLMEDMQKDLNIASGETTADGNVSLESVSCFGACALAPVVVLNDQVMRQQTSATVKTMIQGISVEGESEK